VPVCYPTDACDEETECQSTKSGKPVPLAPAVGSKDFRLRFSSGVSGMVGAVLISISDAKR